MSHSDVEAGERMFFFEDEEVSDHLIGVDRKASEMASVDNPGWISHKGDLIFYRTDKKNQQEHNLSIKQMDIQPNSLEDEDLLYFSKDKEEEKKVCFKDEEKDLHKDMMEMSEDHTDEKGLENNLEMFFDEQFEVEKSVLFLDPAHKKGQSSRDEKKKNNCLTNNLIQFYFKATKNYLDRYIKENSSDVKTRKAWTEMMENYKELKFERADLRAREKGRSGTMAQEGREQIEKGQKRKGKCNTTTNFSLQGFTRMFRNRTLRKPLSQMFRSRYLYREIVRSSISLKKEYLKYVPIFVKGFKQRFLGCLH